MLEQVGPDTCGLMGLAVLTALLRPDRPRALIQAFALAPLQPQGMKCPDFLVVTNWAQISHLVSLQEVVKSLGKTRQ